MSKATKEISAMCFDMAGRVISMQKGGYPEGTHDVSVDLSTEKGTKPTTGVPITTPGISKTTDVSERMKTLKILKSILPNFNPGQ